MPQLKDGKMKTEKTADLPKVAQPGLGEQSLGP